MCEPNTVSIVQEVAFQILNHVIKLHDPRIRVASDGGEVDLVVFSALLGIAFSSWMIHADSFGQGNVLTAVQV